MKKNMTKVDAWRTFGGIPPDGTDTVLLHDGWEDPRGLGEHGVAAEGSPRVEM